MSEHSIELFAVFCEARSHPKPLLLHDLTLHRVFDEIILPSEKNEPFIIDGAPLTRTEIVKLKVLRQGPNFAARFGGLHSDIREILGPVGRGMADQYHIRVEAIFRESCEDVTGVVLSAYRAKIYPRLKDYLPNRKEVLDTATKFFFELCKFYRDA